LWQWLQFEAPLDDGRDFTRDLFEDWLADELRGLADVPNLMAAARLLHELVTDDTFEEFLTLPAYPLLP
jgi:malate synthase